MTATGKTLSHPAYRADIDGLRAVAILPVVGFHAFPYWIRGGFVGVDVFFVISGFLISSVIIGSLERGSFSFTEFYARRIRRIFPALALVLVACYSFGWFALLADEYKQLGKHLAAGAAFVSNFILWQEAGYFDSAADVKPLLHLWSLGIEEQFYIVWPLAVYVCWKRQLNILTLGVVLMAASLAFSVNRVHVDPVGAFYSPLSRFWELMAGSILAYCHLHQIGVARRFRERIEVTLKRVIYRDAAKHAGPSLASVQAILGAILIAYSGLFLTRDTAFPGWWALLPTLGAVLVISAGADAWLNRTILSWRPIVWIGLISFPLYLWHWPLLSFLRIVYGSAPSPAVRIATIFISVVLASLTYLLLERPLRFGRHKTVATVGLCLAMGIIGIVGYQTYVHEGFKSRAAAAGLADSFNTKPFEGCDVFGWAGGVCRVGDGPSKANVILIGDSFAHAYSPFVFHSRLYTPFTVTEAALQVCPLFFGYGPTACQSAAEKVFDVIKTHENIKYVFLAGNYSWYQNDGAVGYYSQRVSTPEGLGATPSLTSREAFERALIHTVSEYRKLGRSVVILLTPPYGKDPKDCAPRLFKVSKCDIDRSTDAIKTIEAANKRLLALWTTEQQPIFFDPFTYLCDPTTCHLTNGGSEIYYDDSWHLGEKGGEFLAGAAKKDFSRLLETPSIGR